MMLKKLMAALIAVLVTTAAFAANGNDMPLPSAAGVNLISPHQEGSWSFGAQANYFEANNNFNYAYLDTTVLTDDSQIHQYKTYMVKPDYNWGWGVDVTYHFPGDGRDVTLAFTQLNSSHRDSTSVGDNPDPYTTFLTGTGLFFDNIPFDVDADPNYDEAMAKVSTNYDAIDLSFGQVIAIGQRISLHPFAGVRYGYIDYKASAQYQLNLTVEENYEQTADQNLKSRFQGVGPRLGSDATVNLGRGFSLGGTLGVSLLAGSMNTSVDYSFIQMRDGDLESANYAQYNSNPGARLVPEADAKVSAMYHTYVDNGYSLGFEVGYQLSNYFDALQTSTDSETDTALDYSNFFMQGPYARVQLDVA